MHVACCRALQNCKRGVDPIHFVGLGSAARVAVTHGHRSVNTRYRPIDEQTVAIGRFNLETDRIGAGVLSAVRAKTDSS